MACTTSVVDTSDTCPECGEDLYWVEVGDSGDPELIDAYFACVARGCRAQFDTAMELLPPS